jgi:lysozyme family protein
VAGFDSIFSKVLKHEGYYANLSGDQGGMTYAGIARNFHGSWQGWKIIDQVIAMRGGSDLPNNHYIHDPLLDQYVRDFYLELWRKSMAGSIRNQDIAHLYFDFYVHSRKAVQQVQQVLVSMGYKIAIDNRAGNATIFTINSHPYPAVLHDAIKRQRISYLNEISAYGSNAQFLPGWLARLADFPDLSTSQKTITFGVIIAISLIGLYLLNK